METLGSVEEWDETRAEEALDRRLAEAKLGIWKPRRPEPQAAEEADGEPDDPEFRTFALEWLAMREQEGLGERTIEDYRWCVEKHLLRYFYSHRLGDITVREVDRLQDPDGRRRASVREQRQQDAHAVEPDSLATRSSTS